MSEQDKTLYRHYLYMILAGVFWLLFCVIAFSDAGFNILFILLALPVALIWALFWFVRLIIAIRRQQDEGNVKKILTPYMIEPTLIVVPLLLAYFGIFSSARFMLSEQALSDYAEQVRAGKVNLAFEFNHPSRNVGLYYVTFTELLPDGTVRVLTSSHGVMDRAGFVNSRNKPILRRGEDSYKHIHQQWWVWYESW
jgi:hypothetical protein